MRRWMPIAAIILACIGLVLLWYEHKAPIITINATEHSDDHFHWYTVTIPKGKLVDIGLWVNAPDDILIDAIDAKQPFRMMVGDKEFKSRQGRDGSFQLHAITST